MTSIGERLLLEYCHSTEYADPCVGTNRAAVGAQLPMICIWYTIYSRVVLALEIKMPVPLAFIYK